MPNWVTNRINIVGKDSVIQEIKGLIDRQESILRHYFPLPPEASEIRESVGMDGEKITYSVFAEGGYDTALELWGTKWADCDAYIVDGPTPVIAGFSEIVINCQSAWSPPHVGFQRLSEKFDLLIGMFFEEEQPDYIGYQVFSNGEDLRSSEMSGDQIHNAIEEFPSKGTDEEINQWYHNRHKIISGFCNLLSEQLDRVMGDIQDKWLYSVTTSSI